MKKMYFSKSQAKNVFTTTNGCSENRFDCAKMKEFFTKNGWLMASNIQEADIILFNACGLTNIRENDSLRILKQINAQKKPSADVIVWGCFPKINKKRIEKAHKGIIFDSDESERLEDIFEGKIKARETQANFLVPLWEEPLTFSKIFSRLPHIVNIQPVIQHLLTRNLWERAYDMVSFVDSDAFFIKVSTGCLNACSFCGVCYSRGKLKSKPIDKITEEFKDGLEKNFRKFILIGTDLSAYGRDQGTNLVYLLKALLKNKGDFKLRLPNLNPKFLVKMIPEGRELFKSGKIEVIGTAFQSGSNRILRLMKRGYRIEDYKEAMSILKMEYPDLRVRTNIMVGFPSETEQDFQETLRVISEVNFTYADIHRYSPRSRTKAAKMPEQIPPKVIEDRYYRLIVACSKHYRKSYRKDRK